MNEIRKVRSKNYPLVIEINAPFRFYWTEKGYDGVEVSLNPKTFTRHQRQLLHKVFAELGGKLSDGIAEVPDVFKKVFEGKEEEN